MVHGPESNDARRRSLGITQWQALLCYYTFWDPPPPQGQTTAGPVAVGLCSLAFPTQLHEASLQDPSFDARSRRNPRGASSGEPTDLARGEGGGRGRGQRASLAKVCSPAWSHCLLSLSLCAQRSRTLGSRSHQALHCRRRCFHPEERGRWGEDVWHRCVVCARAKREECRAPMGPGPRERGQVSSATDSSRSRRQSTGRRNQER